MSIKKLSIAAVSIVLVLAVVFFSRAAQAETLTVVATQETVQLEIVDTPETRQLGLSGRESLAQEEGMLFVFDNELTPSFWMKDMQFSLDIVWIDADKTVVSVADNISPETFPETFSPERDILYVLEVNAGLAAGLGLEPGAVVDF